MTWLEIYCGVVAILGAVIMLTFHTEAGAITAIGAATVYIIGE